MGGQCAMNGLEALHPASGSLPEGGAVRRARARLRLPGTARSIRVRSLALGISVALHLLAFGALAAARLAAPLPVPPALVEVEFVEIPGPRGGGGNPAQTSRGKAAASVPRAAPLTNLAPRPSTPPAQAVAPAAAPASVAASSVSPTGAAAPTGGSDGGSGGGSGGGQGTGTGISAGSGTGQGGVAVDRMPTPLRQLKPRYPMAARRLGQSGQVQLRLYVDQQGAVREVTVVRAEPAGVFEDAALEAVRKWRFEPAMFKGAPVGVWMSLPVRFSLDER